MLQRLILLACCLAAAGCERTPVEGDAVDPVLTLSQVERGDISLVISTDGSVTIDAPDQCDDGHIIIGSVWQVDGFPVRLMVSGTDAGGVEWLRLHSQAGSFSDPDPASVRVGERTVGTTTIRYARASYPADDPRSPRFFAVTLTPDPGETIVDVEGGVSDTAGRDVYTWVVSIGTNEVLCAAF